MSTHADLTMQEALIRLTEYWAAQGCLVAQPMNTEVGAGTLNPATALRVLGPEPWRVGYVEPSVRPDDSRYGDNPNRLQTHTQYQVILKPEPGDAQDLYLGSLRALGIDLDRHDIRFVEDNWASPALGAWGLGWEVWLDGLEITQFTYFQQSGGVSLDPVSVEITYGMERIVMALQRVTHFAEIRYAPGISYGEVFGQVEYEMSRYYLDDADVETNRRLFEAYAGEARRMLDARLPVPAHSYVLKCSHAFNVLDSRGAVGTAERARAFARMRSLAHEVATRWIERRAELGHPLGVATTPADPGEEAEPARPGGYPQIDAPAPLAFEIGTEELPPDEVTRSAEAVREMLTERLAATRLGHRTIRVVSSPRRIVALVADVQPREEDFEQTVRGPRLSVAYDADGAPTKAAHGFARAQGVDVGELRRLSLDGGEYVGVIKQVAGRPAAEVLAAVLPEVVTGLRADRNMRWFAPGSSFSRPIRWLLALLGETVVPFSAVGLEAGRRTRVHRTAGSPEIEVASAAGYLDRLSAHGIVADGTVRREMVLRQAVELAASVHGVIDVAGEREVVAEVTNLVEEPVAILGSFAESYLELPADVLITVMRKHQRYISVRDPGGRLLPYFVAVANGECDREAVRAGNEAVLRARYEDASFFWAHDLRTPPERMAEGLAGLTFTERLGSMADRADRIRGIALELAGGIDLDGDERAALERAGQLAKFDLASQLVIELSSLAGVMAGEYALRAGEDDGVAEALFEMELPRFAGDTLPQTVPGALLAVADRLDLLTGLFATGAVPSGSSDPFGLRRAALGLTAILRTQPRLAAVTVDAGLDVAARHQPVEVSGQAREEAAAFVARRFEQYLLDADHPVHVVRAVRPYAATPARAEQAAADLEKLLDDPQFERICTALDRVLRIVPADTVAGYDPALFTEPAEHRLAEAAGRVRADVRDRTVSLPEFAATAGVLVEPIDTYFDDVLVMAEDPAVRANRLGLLATVRDLVAGILDWREVT